MSDTTTRGVRVRVQSRFVPERSAPDASQYFFAYRVIIDNVGDDVVQLVTRHWIITDANGKVDEVRGPGVIGETPVLKPGQSFTYTSACPLPTQVGTMHGAFQMVYPDSDARGFDATIEPFRLEVPGSIH